MGRWKIRHDDLAILNDDVFVGWGGTEEEEANGITNAHNADCDAYEARIAELESHLARIAALVKPVPVADLASAGTEAPKLLAERHRQIRAILEEEA